MATKRFNDPIEPMDCNDLDVGPRAGPAAGLVGIEGGVVSGVFNLESPSVEAPGRRPRHEKCYHGT